MCSLTKKLTSSAAGVPPISIPRAHHGRQQGGQEVALQHFSCRAGQQLVWRISSHRLGDVSHMVSGLPTAAEFAKSVASYTFYLDKMIMMRN